MEALVTLVLAVLSAFGPGSGLGDWTAAMRPQTPPAAMASTGVDFFSGEVAEISTGSIEVVRSALGKNESRRFSVNDETKFEGKAKRGSRVTVGYYAKSPEVAVTVIVRDTD